MKKLALFSGCLFVLLFTQQAKAQIQGSYLTIPSIVPTDTVSVCLDTFQITINITNDSLVTINSLAVEHIFPAGINFAGIFTGADSVDNTNSNAPVFFIDSIAGNGFASITLSVFAGCDFADFYNNKNPTI